MHTNGHDELKADGPTSRREWEGEAPTESQKLQPDSVGDGRSTAPWGVRVRLIDAMVILAIVVGAGLVALNRSATSDAAPSAFAQGVNLTPLSATAVHADGRLRSFESHATTYMKYISGPRAIHQQSAGFTYLDMIFRPERYLDADIIYVKNKSVRAQILSELRSGTILDADRAESSRKTGLFSRRMLSRPAVVALLQRLGQDLIRTSKDVDAIHSAMAVADESFLRGYLRFIPPPSGRANEPWLPVSAIWGTHRDHPDHDKPFPGEAKAGVAPSPGIFGLDPTIEDKLRESWAAVRSSWLEEDAAGVNAQLARFAATLPEIAPDIYPPRDRLAMESWYFRNKSMTWVWLIYLAAVVPLLIFVIHRWEGIRMTGLVLFVVAFTAHSASVGLRWYISGRWPNSNMFEAVTTSAWFGGAAALVLELIARRTAFRGLFALGSSVMSMVALMAAYYLPVQLNSGISNKMAALNDIWIYIHTNMIIWSYALIGLACVPALLLLRHRWCLLWDQGRLPRLRLAILPVALVVLNYTGYVLLMHMIANSSYGLSLGSAVGFAATFSASLAITVLECFSARERRLAGIAIEGSAGGGAAALIGTAKTGRSFLVGDRPSATRVFDAAAMVLIELSFIMLWTGVVMGAIWADHSWGRPWGWDPKEVFALNTFIVFLVLIHVRIKVRDKAFWTAVLAVVGFEVMMFNWIVVNFVITGLHSYA